MSDKENIAHSATEHDPQHSGVFASDRRLGIDERPPRIFGKEADSPEALRALSRQNKPGGVMCTSCARAKPANPHVAEFCENGAKATLWELTSRRCTPDFSPNTL